MNRIPALKPVMVDLLAALALCAPGLAPAPAAAAERAATATVVPKVWPTPQHVRPGQVSPRP
ncbi:hypothetical protein GCM10010094_63350 [Streptomyces flaveus]|uniref:Uncharacterized protein n=1 Tax=Streptomyces flaveus TaxID=66370 RepID=A0A917R7W6_9ACTN|nr:hypothetical protein GCM10010094_63350 [Streptomyces flaveus]